jgi:hypothetical protein
MPPVITFVSPPSKTDSSPAFTWRSTEEAVFECSFDGRSYGDCGTGTNGQWRRDNVRDGRHTLLVRGRDTVGNLGRPTSLSWDVGTFLITEFYTEANEIHNSAITTLICFFRWSCSSNKIC